MTRYGIASRPAEPRTAISRDAAATPGKRTLTEALPARSTGAALPAGLSSRLGGALGADVSSVRVHIGDDSASAADGLAANAFAVGQDVHFAAGQYNPGTPAGDRLIAHEVAHTVQQRGQAAAPQRDAAAGVSQPGDAHEVEAESFAQAFVRGGSHPVTSSAPGAPGAIARDPVPGAVPAAPGDDAAPAFTPRVTVTPPAKPLLLGGTAAIGFELQNAKELPAGARLEWLPVVDGVTLETAGVTSADKPKTALKVHATAPGRDTPTALLNVYDKTGKMLATLGEAPDLTVPKPTGTWAFERHGADGSKSPDVTRVTVGDKLHTRLTLDQVDPAIQSLGPPLGGYSPADRLTMDAGQWTAAKVFERDLSAIKIGATEGELTWRTGKMEPADALSTQVKTNVEMAKQEWDTALRLAEKQVAIEFLSLNQYVRSMANAYATAYTKHGDVLKEQADFNKLIGDAVIGAILAFTTGGLGGAVNKAMEALSAGKFLVEGITDLSKFGSFPAQKVADGAQGDAAKAGGLTAMPADPLRWQNEFHNRVDAEHQAVLKAMLEWDTRSSKHDATFFRNFDPEAAVADSLTHAGQRLSQLTPLEPAPAALEFERRLWQKWLDKYAFQLVKHSKTTYPTLTDPMGPSAEKVETSYDVNERTPDKIKDRCAQIGLDYAKYAGGIKQRYETEAARRNKAIADYGAYKDDPYGDD